MKKRIIGIGLVILVATCSFSQEICDNGIDDDLDGLIDLNDSEECFCSDFTSTISIPSLIKNPSFEEYTSCPTAYGQIDLLKDWENSGSGTADFLHTCGYYPPAMTSANLLPFPDGNGITGIIIEDNLTEFLGSCLLSPLLKNNSYTLKLDIAHTTTYSNPVDISLIGILADDQVTTPIELTIYGAESCSSFPVDGFSCPSDIDPNWTVLSKVTYTPKNSWESLTFTFTPDKNINTIIIGPPCNIPDEYPTFELSEDKLLNAYFYFDNLILNETKLFNSIQISETGSFCTNDLVLNTKIPSNFPSNSTFQWYKNGIALKGEKGLSYTVKNGNEGIGNYQVKIFNSELCGVSSSFEVINESLPNATISPSVQINQGESTQLSASGGILYEWTPAIDLSCVNCSNPIATPTKTTEYCVKVSNGGTCTSSACSKVKITSDCGELFVPTSFSPNDDNLNDLFEVKMNPDCIENFELLIFDRWGEKVFETSQITNSWDGKYKGKKLDNAIFVYRLKMKLVNDTNEIIKKGNVSIIK